MKTISLLEQKWTEDRRYMTRYMLVFTGSTFIHLILLLLFAIMGYPQFAAMNAASILLYIGWLLVFARVQINDFLLLVLYLDVVLHASVYNITFGAAPGFFLYPFIIIPVTFFLSARDLKHAHTIFYSSVLSVASVVVMLATLSREALVQMADPSQVQQFFQINVLFCALLLSVYTSEFMTETLNTQDSLSHHAETDPLTGLWNRYGFRKETERIHGTQYAVVMCDIDNFKQINDLYGHSVGDELLCGIAHLFASSIQKNDAVCRWGGEEFLMILCANFDDALARVEQLRSQLSQVAVETKNGSVHITMTFGVAGSMEADSFDTLVKIADTNLLRGKRSGKNCVVQTESHTPEISGILQPNGTELDTSFLNERMFSAFAATSDTTYIYVCNLNTNVSRWSRTAVDYFGLPSEYMYDAGNVWLGFIHPDDREAYSRDVDAVLSGKKHFHDISYRARNRNGEYVSLTCRGVVTEGDAEHPAIFAGTITNLGIVSTAGMR